MLDGLGMPGAIRPASIADPLTGQQIEVAVSPGFVRLSVDGRDYFFDRLNGRLTSGAGR